MSSKLLVSPKAFSAIQRVNTNELSQLNEAELRPLLPCLVRMALCAALDQSLEWAQKRKVILQLLSGIELVNSLVALLSIDFHGLEVDVKKEQQRCKAGTGGESALISSITNGLALEFERSDAARRLRLFLSELLCVMAHVREGRFDKITGSELFESVVYLEEIADVLCIAQAELPGLLLIPDIAESLLHVQNGIILLCRLVANSPDSFREVCSTLITNGEKQDDDSPVGKMRLQALRMLCQMNMSEILAVRGKAVELCHMPGLTIILTLDYCRQEQGHFEDHDSVVGDLVAFISGLLLGNDDKIRNWFGQYFRNCQKKPEGDGNSTLYLLREELLQRLKNLVLFSIDHLNLPDAKVVQASSILRLYCALRGIAGLKFNEEEINLLLQLLTSHPPPSPAGIRFVSLGLCMLLACPSLLSTTDQEKRATDWIQWLLKEESYFGSTSGVNASFGEMLLLIAIHFHSNQISSITDLVCSTLGMKIVIRSNNLARMKTIFTQEIFTDQVVTAHAVKVPVTHNLSRDLGGFLPVHCIHQLLKSRAFTKYKVPIKDWIYKQVCSTIPPLHPLLPALIEVYVNSVLTPSSKGSVDTTNEPITEEEILNVFSKSVFTPEDQNKKALQFSQPMETDDTPSSLTSQLLLLYYLLLYEDTRLSTMKNIVASVRSVKCYSPQFIAKIPIFYLIQRAQRDQQQFAGLFAPLLRLLTTHFPHLCLVQSWLAEEGDIDFTLKNCRIKLSGWPEGGFSKSSLDKAFMQVESCPFQLLSHLDHLLSLPVQQLWPYAQKFVAYLPKLLNHSDYLQILVKAKNVWFKLNLIFPRNLWVMTVNAFQFPQSTYACAQKLTLDDIILDPLHVLRCDKRIFRCPAFMEIVLHMLQAFLAASRTHMVHHTLEHPMLEKTGLLESEKDRDELRTALVATQESVAVQILLECCLPTENDKKVQGLLTNLREIQSLICSHLHQVFISEPSLAKLVHFQTYPSELLPVVVTSVPSLHICLDFLPELLSQADLDKQVFAIELASHLCSQYAIAKSLSIAKLCINICHTLLGVLPSSQHCKLFLPALPALVRMCEAFPPLCEDVAFLLWQLGKICLSRICAMATILPTTADMLLPVEEVKQTLDYNKLDNNNIQQSDNDLCYAIQKSFVDLCYTLTLDKSLY